MPPNPNSTATTPNTTTQAPDILTRYGSLTLGTSPQIQAVTDSIKADINAALRSRGSAIPNAPHGIFSTNGSVTKIDATTPQEVKNAALALVTTHITSQADTTHAAVIGVLNSKIRELETAVAQHAMTAATTSVPRENSWLKRMKNSFFTGDPDRAGDGWSGFVKGATDIGSNVLKWGIELPVRGLAFTRKNIFSPSSWNGFFQYFDPTHKKFWVNDARGTTKEK